MEATMECTSHAPKVSRLGHRPERVMPQLPGARNNHALFECNAVKATWQLASKIVCIGKAPKQTQTRSNSLSNINHTSDVRKW